MTKKEKLTLAIALLVGAVTMFATIAWINRTLTESERGRLPPARLLRAKVDMKPGHVLDPSRDLETAVLTPSRAEEVSSFVRESDAVSLRGQKIWSDVSIGEMLTYSHLAARYDLDLADGMRAVSLDVGSAGRLGGILEPNDRVDVVVSWPKPPPEKAPSNRNSAIDGTGGGASPQFDIESLFASVAGSVSAGGASQEWESEIVLSDVRILAVGTQLSRTRKELAMEGVEGKTRDSNIVTIEVTDEQALLMLKKSRANKLPISLLLRPKNEG